MPITPTSQRRVVSPNQSAKSGTPRVNTLPPKRPNHQVGTPQRPTARPTANRPVPGPRPGPPPQRATGPRWEISEFRDYYEQQVSTADRQLNDGDTKGAKETLAATVKRLLEGMRQFNQTPPLQAKIEVWLTDMKLRLQNVNNGAESSGGSAPIAMDSPTQQSNSEVDAAVEGVVAQEIPNIKWEDVIGIDDAVERVREAVELPHLFPQLFEDGGLQPWRGVLLWGPPGTGKTMLAQAAANGVKAKYYVVTSADINSKWMGQGEKFVKSLFKSARQQPSIIFIDEIDAILKARGDNEHEATRRIKTQFLQEMEGFTPQHQVTVIGATNVPWEIDDAALRRLEARVWVALPNEAARCKMFKSKVSGFTNNITDDQFRELAAITPNYSGNDIKIAVKDAAFVPVRAVARATHFVQDATGLYEPCAADTPGAIPRPSPDECKDLPLRKGITFEQLKEAVLKNPPAVDHIRMKKYEDYKKRLENDRD